MSKKILIITIITFVMIALATIGLVVWLVVDLNVPPKFEIKDSKLIVKDTYKAEIDLTDAEIILSDEKLELTKRVVGTASGSIRKGKYTIKDVENTVYLSIMKFGEQYIFIKNGEERYYINMNTNEATLDLYNKLLNAKK